MAQSTLPVLSLPEFPQVYAAAIDEAIACVDRVLLAHKRPELELCEFVHPESCGPAAGLSCREPGTIFSLSDEQEYCAEHFREVSRG